MNPGSIALVKTSWQQLLPIQDAAASLFYGRLFELDPALRPMFRGDMVEQGRKLMTMVTMVVANLDNLALLLGAVEDAWAEAYATLACAMKQAAYAPA